MRELGIRSMFERLRTAGAFASELVIEKELVRYVRTPVDRTTQLLRGRPETSISCRCGAWVQRDVGVVLSSVGGRVLDQYSGRRAARRHQEKRWSTYTSVSQNGGPRHKL